MREDFVECGPAEIKSSARFSLAVFINEHELSDIGPELHIGIHLVSPRANV